MNNKGECKISNLNKNNFLFISYFSNLTDLNLEILTNNIDGIEKLLSNNHDINEVNTEGFTPLCEAIMLNNYDISKYLINNGADINGSNKFIPLLIAAENGNDQIMELLLKNNVNPNQLDINGFNALDHLFNKGCLKELKIQRKCQSIPSIFLKENSYLNNDIRCIDLLNDAGIDINHTTRINYRYDFNRTVLIDINALTIALNNFPIPSKEVIKKLIKLGIDLQIIELVPKVIYAYQDSFSFIHDIKNKNLIAWKKAFFEYLEYLKYLNIIRKFNIEAYTINPYDGYRRTKLIKELKK